MCCVCVLQNAVLCHRDTLKRLRRPKLCCVVMCCALKRPRPHCSALLVVSPRQTQEVHVTETHSRGPSRPWKHKAVLCCALKRPRQHCYRLLVVSTRRTQVDQHDLRNIKPQAFAFISNCLKARNFSHLFLHGSRFSIENAFPKEIL